MKAWSEGVKFYFRGNTAMLLDLSWNIITICTQYTICMQSKFCKNKVLKNISPMLQWCNQDVSKGGESLTRMSCPFWTNVVCYLLKRLTKRGVTNTPPPTSYCPVGSFACTLECPWCRLNFQPFWEHGCDRATPEHFLISHSEELLSAKISLTL